MGKTLVVNEIFFSLMGESGSAGLPAVFIRLTGCNLRCGYCDTTYAYEEGREMAPEEIIDSVSQFKCRAVLITGGEPMLQGETANLAIKLLELGYKVMVETNGTIDLEPLPSKVVKIVDIKSPQSGAEGSFLPKNLEQLTPEDEIKFVVSSKEDFDWAVKEAQRLNLFALCAVNISPVHGKVAAEDAAKWILESGRNFRLNLQLHKILWGEKRGV